MFRYIVDILYTQVFVCMYVCVYALCRQGLLARTSCGRVCVHTAPHYNRLRHTATSCNTHSRAAHRLWPLHHTKPQCNTIQRTASCTLGRLTGCGKRLCARCNTLQDTAPRPLGVLSVCERLCRRHVTNMNQSCHIQLRHYKNVNASYDTCERVLDAWIGHTCEMGSIGHT